MPFRKVSAENGFRWLVNAARLIASHPIPFLLMGVLIACVSQIPLIGPLALAILGPALYAGLVRAAADQVSGSAARFEVLFSGLQTPSLAPRLVKLCLPGLAAGFVLALLTMLLLGDVLDGIAAGGDPAELLAAGIAGNGAILLALAVLLGIGSYALVFFAIPGVMLSGAEPLPAMRDSLRACLANVGAFLLFLVTVMAAVMLLSVLVSWTGPRLAQVLAMSITTPWASTALYFAYRDVFHDAKTQLPTAPPSIEA